MHVDNSGLNVSPKTSHSCLTGGRISWEANYSFFLFLCFVIPVTAAEILFSARSPVLRPTRGITHISKPVLLQDDTPVAAVAQPFEGADVRLSVLATLGNSNHLEKQTSHKHRAAWKFRENAAGCVSRRTTTPRSQFPAWPLLFSIQNKSLRSSVRAIQHILLCLNGPDKLEICDNFFDFGDGNWRQVKAWNLLLAEAVEVNALAQETLRRFTQWPRVEHQTFQLRGGHSTTGLSPRESWVISASGVP